MTINIQLTELENGWELSIFNSKTGTVDIENKHYRGLLEAIKDIPARVEKVKQKKDE